MNSAPLILAFDTSGPHCVAALCKGTDLLEQRQEMLARGQSERLMGLLEDVLSARAVTWQDLTAIGVGVGPGNFTGIRIAVSAARGLAMGLGIPAVGVTGCEARGHFGQTGQNHAIPAPRDQAYLCDPGDPVAMPVLTPRADLPAATIVEHTPPGLAAAIARVALERWQTTTSAPAPLYLRAADAAPARDLPPVILDP